MSQSAFEAEIRNAFATYWLPPDLTEQPDATPLWQPLPGPQTMARDSQADILFFGGQAGGGKSDLLLGLAVTSHRNSAIYRTEFTQFRGPDGLWSRSQEIIGSRGTPNNSTLSWRGLPGGRAFECVGVMHDKDVLKRKGHPHDLKAFDELPEFSEQHFRFLMGWLRTTVVGQRVRVVGTGNPPTTRRGAWVIRYWAPWLDKQHPNPAQPGELRWFATIDGQDVELPDNQPVTDSRGEVVRPMSRTFIPARVEDNPYYMRTGYVDVLNNLPEPLRSQLRFGDFAATQDDDTWQVIPTAWIVAAQRRWREDPKPDLALSSAGVDPARGGRDKFCVAKRYGYWIDRVVKYDAKLAPDGASGVGLILQALGSEHAQTVNVDIGGAAGSSVYDHARELKLPVIALDGSRASTAKDDSGQLGFVNKRAEWHWHLRQMLDPSKGHDLALPDDPELLSDLCAATWRPTPRGIKVEEKVDIKARLGRSPDVGEAVMYTFAEDVFSMMDRMGSVVSWAEEGAGGGVLDGFSAY